MSRIEENLCVTHALNLGKVESLLESTGDRYGSILVMMSAATETRPTGVRRLLLSA